MADGTPAGWNARVDIGDGITIGRLGADEAEAVMDAAETAGENFQASRLVTFVRHVSDEEVRGRSTPWAVLGSNQ